MDSACQLVQIRGYNGFSFHDLAEMVGIRTASIHYHFPTKADLGQALMLRYSASFMAALGDPALGEPRALLERYISLFRTTLLEGRMCLCGMVSAEIGGVPEPMGRQAHVFFKANEEWLQQVLVRIGQDESSGLVQARLILAALEGAMLMARTGSDISLFDQVSGALMTRHTQG
ncbi:MAG: TetR/AcrR family transcriptional regulator [Beijerinckiaceae bacterium]